MTKRSWVEGRSSLVAQAARSLLDDRFAEIRIDSDGYVVLTVIDLTPADVEAIDGFAREAGIARWVRSYRADPAALAAWEQVRHELIRLRDTRPGVLSGYPSPVPGYRRPPFRIRLAAYATDVAAVLHERFGTFVALQVGALPYPPKPGHRPWQLAEATPPTLDPDDIQTELDGPLSIHSGHLTRHPLRLTNLGDTEFTVNTNGHLTASVIDPESHLVVGGYTGIQSLPLVWFPVPPGATVHIPLLVETASFDPQLGYAVPAGAWALRAPFILSDGRELSTPPLPFTITE